jgi:hypothetical protein
MHYPIFVHTILAGLVPPFSPNAVTILAGFAFAFEAFLGVAPLVALFLHFFNLCVMAPT